MSIIVNANELNYNPNLDLFKDIESMESVKNLNRYPEIDNKVLISAFSNYINGKNKTDFDFDNIIAGNGSDELIEVIYRTFGMMKADKPNQSSMLFHYPSFSQYEAFASVYGCRTIRYTSSKNFEINVDEMIEIAQKEKPEIVFFCNPNNPTGYEIPKEDILKFCEFASTNKALENSIVVIDEAYAEFCQETFVADVLNYPNAIVLKTLSKSFGLAGLRVGFGIGNKDLISKLKVACAPYNVSSFSQEFATKVLSSKDYIINNREFIKDERIKLINALSQVEDIKVFESSTNFIFVQSSIDLYSIFNENNVSIRSFQKDENFRDYYRISVGTKEENIEIINIITKIGGLNEK